MTKSQDGDSAGAEAVRRVIRGRRTRHEDNIRQDIATRTEEGRRAAQARGVPFDRPPKLRPDQRTLARQLIEEGKSISDAARTFNVHVATIYRASTTRRPYDSTPFRSHARSVYGAYHGIWYFLLRAKRSGWTGSAPCWRGNQRGSVDPKRLPMTSWLCQICFIRWSSIGDMCAKSLRVVRSRLRKDQIDMGSLR